MDEKFSLNDIAQLLTEQAGIDFTKSESFIKGLVELINEGIHKDGIVRIKGFGTFKVILVKERESIHVNTGERILIPSHHKLSFKPDDELKELINKPFSIFETIEDTNQITYKIQETSSLSDTEISEKTELDHEEEQLISDPQIIDDQPNENISDVEDNNEVITPPTIIPINHDQESKNIPPPPPVKGEDKPIAKTNMPDEESEAPWITNKIREENAEPKIQAKTSKPNATRQHKKKSSLMPLYIILGILILISIGCVWYYFSYTRSFDSFVSDNYNTKVSNEFALPGDTTEVVSDNSHISSRDSLLTQTDTSSQKNTNSQTSTITEKRENSSTPSSAPKTSVNTSTNTSVSSTGTSKVLAEVTMESGNRLTLLALKYYGSKVFWVYIYDYNKDKIGSNPDNVKAGMKLLIPAKEVYGIDVNDVNSREKARKLQTQLMAGKK